MTQVIPHEGVLHYDEGLHIGYRAWIRDGVAPAYPFGHGLGYTTWSGDTVERDGDDLIVKLTNTGARPGKHVVQVYVEREDSTVQRPALWLVGFAVARADAGKRVKVRIPVPERRDAHWTEGGWECETGTFTLRIAASVADAKLSIGWAVG